MSTIAVSSPSAFKCSSICLEGNACIVSKVESDGCYETSLGLSEHREQSINRVTRLQLQSMLLKASSSSGSAPRLFQMLRRLEHGC